MNTNDLSRFILDNTRVYRKGEVIKTEQRGNVNVTEIFAMPPADDATIPLVDVHFMAVGVSPCDVTMLTRYLDQLATDYPRFRDGLSYIELGAVLESQDLALRLMALGTHLNLWQMITPASMGITGSQADEMAGMGIVMTSGYRR